MWKKKGNRSQRAVALGLAQGLSQIEAVKQAGYSDCTAERKACQIVRRPQIQNFLTDALEALGVTAKKILQPIKDGLEACEVVKTQKGKILTRHPDHKIRIMAHDRAVALYDLAGKHTDRVEAEAAGTPRVVNVNVVFVEPPNRDPQPDIPEVKFLQGPR